MVVTLCCLMLTLLHRRSAVIGVGVCPMLFHLVRFGFYLQTPSCRAVTLLENISAWRTSMTPANDANIRLSIEVAMISNSLGLIHELFMTIWRDPGRSSARPCLNGDKVAREWGMVYRGDKVIYDGHLVLSSGESLGWLSRKSTLRTKGEDVSRRLKRISPSGSYLTHC